MNGFYGCETYSLRSRQKMQIYDHCGGLGGGREEQCAVAATWTR